MTFISSLSRTPVLDPILLAYVLLYFYLRPILHGPVPLIHFPIKHVLALEFSYNVSEWNGLHSEHSDVRLGPAEVALFFKTRSLGL